jgi:hypothetical protein
MPATTPLDLLDHEYQKLQDIIEKNDDRALQIKGWSVTVCLAGVIAALTSDKLTEGRRAEALAAAALAAIAFWLIEAYWRTSQRAFFARINAIEDAFRDGTEGTLAPFQIGRSWLDSYHRNPRHVFWHIAGEWRIMLPHLLVAALALAAAGLHVLD